MSQLVVEQVEDLGNVAYVNLDAEGGGARLIRLWRGSRPLRQSVPDQLVDGGTEAEASLAS